MNLRQNQLDFKGQHFYIGLDVHKRNWTVCIRTRDLFLKTFSMNPSPNELRDYLVRHYPGGSYHSVYEAGFCGFWVHRRLVELGIENIVTNAADVPTTHKEKRRKRDKVDAKKLSMELANQRLEALYVPAEFDEHLRSLHRLSVKEAGHRTRLKNRIRGFLNLQGIELPERAEFSPWSGRFIRWLEKIEFSNEPAREYLDFCLEELRDTRQRVLSILRKLRVHSRVPSRKKIIHDYLKSVPGVGFITAMTFYCEVIDIKRFSNLDKLCAYVGLVPDCHCTGESDVDTGLTFRCNRYLRYLLIEAAWVAVRRDPALTLKYEQLCQRMKKQKAIIRIAKKLICRMRHVWINETQYICSVVE